MKKRKLASLLLISVLAFSSLAGCSKPVQEQNVEIQFVNEKNEDYDEGQQITITDQIGREVTLKKPAEKLVSSYYISTAIFVSLGLEDNLVGIEAKADTRGLYNLAAPELLDLPAIGTGKGINIEEVANLDPDVVVIPKKLSDAVEILENLDIPVIVVNPETLEDFKECVDILGKITATEEKSNALLNYYDEKMTEVSEMTASLTELPKVYLSAGSDYFSTCTSKMYQNEMIAISGGDNVSKELEDGYWQTISAEQLNLWQPDYIFAVSYAEYSLDDIRNDIALAEINAIKDDNVFSFPSAIEPWDYPTPSSVLGVLYLTHTLHPDLYREEDYVTEATEFYKEFFDIDVALEDLGL